MFVMSNNITDEQFVKAWTAAKSVSDVSTKLNVTYTTVAARARSLRKAGVKLKEMPRGGKRAKREIDVKALNKLAATSS